MSFARPVLSHLLAQLGLRRGQEYEGNPLSALIYAGERLAPCCGHSMTAAPLCFHPLSRAAKTAVKKKIGRPTFRLCCTDLALARACKKRRRTRNEKRTQRLCGQLCLPPTWQRCSWMGRSAVVTPFISNMHGASGSSMMLLGCNRRCAN